jgi:DNA-binding beta-propeller fold protein YncE
MISRTLFKLALTLVVFGGGPSHAADVNYHVVATYRVSGTGRMGSIRLDNENRRLYVPRGNRVDVLDADTGAPVGSLEASGANDVIIVPELKRGFYSNGGGGSVSVFDPASLKVLKTTELSLHGPAALAFDADTKHVFVTGNGGVAVLDGNSGDTLGNIPLDGELRHVAVNGYGKLYVTAENRNVVYVIDTEASKLLGDFPIGSGAGPSGLAIDPSGRRLFVACTNGRLPIIDTDIGFTFDDLPIGKGEAANVFAFAPQGKTGWRGATFVVSSDGTLSLVRMNAFISYSSAGQVKLQPGVQSVEFDPKTGRLFVSSPEGNQILVVAQ